MRQFRLAVLGGTFDHLHIGHHALLATAFRVGDRVGIGLTTDRFVRHLSKPLAGRLQPYSVRRAALVRWVRRNFPQRKWWVIPIENPFGRSVDREVNALVVSPDTASGGRAVNRERRRLGRPPLSLVMVPLALADDLEPVSSRRVRAGSIGPEGRRVASIRIAVTTDDPRDRSAAERAVRKVFASARLVKTGAPRAAARPDLVVRVARRRAGGWVATERSPRVRLRPTPIRGTRPADLERGLVAMLRPRQ